MALTNKLTNIADAIRDKTGSTATLTLDEMATAIGNISGGSEPILESITITENGTYTPDETIDGYNEVVVNVASSGDGDGLKYIINGISFPPFPSGFKAYWIRKNTTTGYYDLFCNPTYDIDVYSARLTGIDDTIKADSLGTDWYRLPINDTSGEWVFNKTTTGRISITKENIIFYNNVTIMYDKNIYKHSTKLTVVNNGKTLKDVVYFDELIIPSECQYRFAQNNNTSLLNQCENDFVIENITDASYMFYKHYDDNIGNITIKLSDNSNISNIFNGLGDINIPKIEGKCKMFTSMFVNSHISEIPSGKFDNLIPYSNNTYLGYNTFFGCKKLKSIDPSFLKKFGDTVSTGYYYGPYSSTFYDCYNLAEIVDLGINTGNMTSNFFNNTFRCNNKLKRFTFEKNSDGSAITANWKSQVIDMSVYEIGYGSECTACMDGNTYRITNSSSYELYKDLDNAWTDNLDYSFFNHNSAVETINSLPDTSAYLESVGGTNTIKFKGASGSATDGGAINTLTDAEIAVATAKGWTVTLV